MTTSSIVLLCLGAIVTSDDEASASTNWIVEDRSAHERPLQFDVMAHFGTNWIGPALWYVHPALPDGLIRRLNDAFDIEVGAVSKFFVNKSDDRVALVPLGGVRWRFFLTPQWSVFAALKGGYNLRFGRDFGVTVDSSVGGYWHASEDLWLRMEMGFQGVLRVGAAFPFG